MKRSFIPSPLEMLSRMKRPKTEYEEITAYLFNNVHELHVNWNSILEKTEIEPTLEMLNEYLENIWSEIGECFKAHDKEYFKIY